MSWTGRWHSFLGILTIEKNAIERYNLIFEWICMLLIYFIFLLYLFSTILDCKIVHLYFLPLEFIANIFILFTVGRKYFSLSELVNIYALCIYILNLEKNDKWDNNFCLKRWWFFSLTIIQFMHRQIFYLMWNRLIYVTDTHVVINNIMW